MIAERHGAIPFRSATLDLPSPSSPADYVQRAQRGVIGLTTRDLERMLDDENCASRSSRGLPVRAAPPPARPQPVSAACAAPPPAPPPRALSHTLRRLRRHQRLRRHRRRVGYSAAVRREVGTASNSLRSTTPPRALIVIVTAPWMILAGAVKVVSASRGCLGACASWSARRSSYVPPATPTRRWAGSFVATVVRTISAMCSRPARSAACPRGGCSANLPGSRCARRGRKIDHVWCARADVRERPPRVPGDERHLLAAAIRR